MYVSHMFFIFKSKIIHDLKWMIPIMTTAVAIAAEHVARTAPTARSWWVLVATELYRTFICCIGHFSMVKFHTLLLAFRSNGEFKFCRSTAIATHRWHQHQHKTEHHG